MTMSKKLSALVGAVGLSISDITMLPKEAYYVVGAYIIIQGAVDMVKVWKDNT